MSINTKKRRFLGLSTITFGLIGTFIGLGSKASLGSLAMIYIVPASIVLGLLVDVILDEMNIRKNNKVIIYIIFSVVFGVVLYKWIHG